jgi:hypothetical protein
MLILDLINVRDTTISHYPEKLGSYCDFEPYCAMVLKICRKVVIEREQGGGFS